jgi:hypothetical protein
MSYAIYGYKSFQILTVKENCLNSSSLRFGFERIKCIRNFKTISTTGAEHTKWSCIMQLSIFRINTFREMVVFNKNDNFHKRINPVDI